MSDVLEKAAAGLRERLGDGGFDGSVKFDIEGEGAIVINEDGVSTEDGDAACTISASVDTFQDLFAGELDPTAAFMTGKIKVDGDMSVAMKLGQLLG
ncbi:MAG: SCP2 sterol-binding domain-containing protein [Pseudomonadota bacterium]